eukprot:29469_6
MSTFGSGTGEAFSMLRTFQAMDVCVTSRGRGTCPLTGPHTGTWTECWLDAERPEWSLAQSLNDWGPGLDLPQVKQDPVLPDTDMC